MNLSIEEKTIRALGWTFVYHKAWPPYSGQAWAVVKNKKVNTTITAVSQHGETRRELAAMLLTDIHEEIYRETKQLTQPEIEKAEGLSEGIPE